MVNRPEVRSKEERIAALDMEREGIVGRFQNIIDKVRAYVIPEQEK